MTFNRRKRNVPTECPRRHRGYKILSRKDTVWGGRIWYGLCMHCFLQDFYGDFNHHYKHSLYSVIKSTTEFRGGTIRIPLTPR